MFRKLPRKFTLEAQRLCCCRLSLHEHEPQPYGPDSLALPAVIDFTIMVVTCHEMLRYEGTEENIEEVLLEAAPSRPVGQSRWRWRIAGVATVLMMVGLVAKTIFPSSLGFMKTSKRINLDEVEHFEDLPGMDKIILQAKSLRQEKPLRNLGDLFYASQPDELPWIRTAGVAIWWAGWALVQS